MYHENGDFKSKATERKCDCRRLLERRKLFQFSSLEWNHKKSDSRNIPDFFRNDRRQRLYICETLGTHARPFAYGGMKMDFTFNIDNSLIFDISQSDDMKFEIKSMPEKEYIEKNFVPCTVSFSVSALFSDVVSSVFRKEEEEDNLIHGN